MSCYEDVLDAEDRLLGVSGHDITDPHKDDAIKHLSFKIKASPDANTTYSTGQDISRGKDGGVAFKQKFECSRKQDEFDLKWTVTNKDYEFSTEWAPKDLNDGVETVLDSSLKLTPKGDAVEYEYHAGVKRCGDDMGPIRPHFGLQFNSNHKSEHEVEIHENLIYEKDINIASRTVVNVNDKKLAEAQGMLAWKNQEWGQVWFRSNCLKNYMGLGWQGKINGYKQAAEIQYDYKKENLGINGQPVFFKWGLQHTLANGGKMSTSLSSGAQHIMQSKFEMPIDKSLKISYSDKINLKNMFTDPANSGYQSGFNVEFKI